MRKYLIRKIDNGTVTYLVMFGYDGGIWHNKFASADFFKRIGFFNPHDAYNLVNFFNSMYPFLNGFLDVEEVDDGEET